MRAYMPGGGSKTGQTTYYQLTGQSSGQNQGEQLFGSGQTTATVQNSRDDLERFVDMFTGPRSRGVQEQRRTGQIDQRTGQTGGQIIDSQDDRYMSGVYEVGGGGRTSAGTPPSRSYMAGEGAAGGSYSREHMAGRGPLEDGVSRHYLVGQGAAGGGGSRKYMAGEGGYFGGKANI